jgi:3-hydroxymyristoyl/3-hydroxydecanoyl-(acyl carrier protein) dehydratase
VDYTAENILIAANHPCFEGHFPQHPVFPAVAQIDLVLDHLQKIREQPPIVIAITKAKFPAPILPETSVHLHLKIEDSIVFWRIFSSHQTYSQGTIQLA